MDANPGFTLSASPFLLPLHLYPCQEELGLRVTEMALEVLKRFIHGARAALELLAGLCCEQVYCLSLHL